MGYSKFKSMRVSGGEGGGRGGGRGRGGKPRKTLNGNYIKQDGGGGGGSDDQKPQLAQQKRDDALEAALGWSLYMEGPDRLGWLMNFTTASHEDKDSGQVVSAVDCYFMCQDGSMFKARVLHAPYFYLQVKDGTERDVDSWLRRKFEGRLRDIEVVQKEDLDLKNHLSGLKRKLLKVSFWNVQQLMEVRREVAPIVVRNRGRSGVADALSALRAEQQAQQAAMLRDGPGAGGEPGAGEGGARDRVKDVQEALLDLREHDVPYHVRFAIDTGVRAGHWYEAHAEDGRVTLRHREDLKKRAEPVICAFDIETTKLPLQFPNAEYDQVFMISYMLDKQGYLIVNREVVGGDIEDFEFTPKPEFEGPFRVINVADEASLLREWFDHMRRVKPGIMVTYNGDFFDCPFLETRAAKHGLEMPQELGFAMRAEGGGNQWRSRAGVHMDCLHWVNRDSYLPQGSRGLKAVCKAKLGYDPVEVDPEDMLRLAQETPQAMASYSVSDAVATYYLYMTYIHPFIFSLATIIPMPPDEVLRKGSGTLCEQLLMVQAYNANIVCPNKHVGGGEVMYDGHPLETETYIGGKVEAIESGVFRADLPVRFKCKPAAYQSLLDNLDRDMQYAITHDAHWALEDCDNYQEVRAAIVEKLESLRDTPNREEVPLIYHLDVAAMYPNIILTNRLQPSAIVTDEDCAACDFNRPGKNCLRTMDWVWRGEHFSCKRSEYNAIKRQLASETFGPAAPGDDAAGGGFGGRGGGGGGRGGGGGGRGGRGGRGGGGEEEEGGGARSWGDLSREEQGRLLKDRLKKYCQKVYKRVLDKPVVEERAAGICQRENPFYINTVRDFRDRRYEYKGLNKKWKGKLDEARKAGDALAAAEASDMVVLYDSLQLAHKCILNSFYGYVMRKGARWYSMEMAGVVTYTGAQIIQRACGLVEQLGKPLELDTDGIWCALPGSFPENYKLTNKKLGKSFGLSYPCIMLNVMVAEHNTNDQYATLVDPVKKTYEISSEMSIEFEVDGPYKAMILPASKEEGKLIKKRYAVFNFDGSLAELKGFEIKRRGELKLIKVFQAEVFEQFLAGSSLSECYAAVGAVANRWLDMLDTQGVDLSDGELLGYISEATTMSKGMDEYEGRKSCAITTAKRLAQFLGDERIKDKGLNCTYVIARRPESAPTSERAIPVSIFSAEPAVARAWVRKWCGDVGSAPASAVPDVRDIVDWQYYKDRLGSAIQKIISIPAAMQHVANPVPRVKHPDWLHKRVRERDSKSQQLRLDVLFAEQRAKQAAARGGGEGGQGGGGGGGEGEEDEAEEAPVGGRRARGAAVGDIEDLMAGKFAGGGPTTARVRLRRAAARDAGAGSADQEGREAEPLDSGPEDEIEGDEPGGGAAGGGKQQRRGAAGRQDGGGGGDAAAGPRPDRHSDYRGWVAWQKQKWRQVRQERKRRKVEAAKRPAADADAAPAALVPTGNVARFFRQQQARAAAGHWQLLQLAPTAVPGTFKAWVLVDTALYAVPVRVPRTLYVDAEAAPGSPEAALLGRPVRVALPYGRTPHHVYQLSLPEPEWQARHARVALQLLSSGARGAYEAQMPLGLQAALALGCVATVAPGARGRPLGEGFDLAELQYADTTRCGYLEGEGPEGLGPLRYLSLYQSADAGRGRGVLCLLMPATARGLLVVVQPSALPAREVTSTALERAWRDGLGVLEAQGHNTQEQVSALGRVEWVAEYCGDTIEAARLLQRAVLGYREVHRGPLVVAVQCPGGARRLASEVPLLGEFPCIDVPPLSEDSRYPALQWQLRAARRAVHRAAAAGGWLRERAALTRYAHVPLADLGGDPSLAIADTLYARCLRGAGHALWVRDPSLPDPGIEPLPDDDAFLLEDMPSGEVSCPGAYRTICVQLRLHHLAVAALAKAQDLAEMEGASGLDGLGAGAPAFGVLRRLVESWLADATRNSNPIADRLLHNLYRWISNPAGALHDPGLQRALLGLMQRMFLALVADMRRLGATLVSASFGGVLICTGKRNMSAAVGYVRYLLDTLAKRDLFCWLTLTPSRWWHCLLYRDAYNWGGVEATLPPGAWEATERGSGGGGGEGGGCAELEALDSIDPTQIGTPGGPKLSCLWNLKEFLPPALQEHLVLLLAEFVYRPWKEAAAAALRGASQGGSQAVADAEQAQDLQLEYLKRELAGAWGDRLMTKVQAFAAKCPPGSSHPECQFPVLAGSHLSEEDLGSPALAFVRSACHLMGLDAAVSEDVALLRRRLLKLLGVGEFGSAAQFREPCMSFRLPDVICGYCNDCRDLDLCRDPELQAGERWRCACCAQPYDMGAIEGRLLRLLGARLREYSLQDLQCHKCKQIATEHLAGGCKNCGGYLVNTVRPDAARKRLSVFRSLAAYHKFELLQQMADFALGLS